MHCEYDFTVKVPTLSELLRTVTELMKENKADRAESGATNVRLKKGVDPLERDNQTLRSRRRTLQHRGKKAPGAVSGIGDGAHRNSPVPLRELTNSG